LAAASGRFQYPRKTPGPRTRISPDSPVRRGSPVAASAMRISLPGTGLPCVPQRIASAGMYVSIVCVSDSP